MATELVQKSQATTATSNDTRLTILLVVLLTTACSPSGLSVTESVNPVAEPPDPTAESAMSTVESAQPSAESLELTVESSQPTTESVMPVPTPRSIRELLVGKWNVRGKYGKDDEYAVGTWAYGADGALSFSGPTGEPRKTSRREGQTRWSLDETRSPAHLDAVFTNHLGQITGRTMSIVRLAGDDTIEMLAAVSGEADRPASFKMVPPDTPLLTLKRCSPVDPSPSLSQEKLVGRWDVTGNSGFTGSYVFRTNRSAAIVTGNKVVDDETLEPGVNLTWKLDETQSPAHLDLVYVRGGDQEGVARLIVRLVTDNTMQIQLAGERAFAVRPRSFGGNGLIALSRWVESGPLPSSTREKFIGGWDVAGESNSYLFGADGCQFLLPEGVTRRMMEGVSGLKGTWILDETQSPMHLTLVETYGGEEMSRVPGITRFVTDGMIQLLLASSDGTRRRDFRGAQDADYILLTRWGDPSPERCESALSAKPAREKLIGEWVAADKVQVLGSYTFHADHTAISDIGGIVRDSSYYGPGTEMLWELDDGKEPMHLDIVVKREGVELGRLRGIARFVTNDTVQVLRNSSAHGRPENFRGSPEDALILDEGLLLLTRKGSRDSEIYHGGGR